mgnify:CR=1 FL=1|jgi:hypothetical protein
MYAEGRSLEVRGGSWAYLIKAKIDVVYVGQR